MAGKIWKTSRRIFDCAEKTLVMGILNATPDSFSDGGKFVAVDAALDRVGEMIAEGADIVDVGGESSRPQSGRLSVAEEIARVVPIVEAIHKRFDAAISIDTSKSEVAEAAVNAGAEIINDISGLRFDDQMGEVAAKNKTGLVLMHLRGTFETMHKQEPVDDIIKEVSDGLRWSIERARKSGVKNENIALDVGVGFSKTPLQNLELIAKLNQLCDRYPEFPMLIGASRKSFIGKVLDDLPVEQRANGSLACAVIATWNGAGIIRTHDVRETVHALRIVDALKREL